MSKFGLDTVFPKYIYTYIGLYQNPPFFVGFKSSALRFHFGTLCAFILVPVSLPFWEHYDLRVWDRYALPFWYHYALPFWNHALPF